MESEQRQWICAGVCQRDQVGLDHPQRPDADTGRYSLFATNRVAGTNSTPVPLIVVEAVD